MRKRIQQLARGRFEYDRTELTFSEEEIAFEVVEEQDYTGSFTISGKNHAILRGVVYSTNPRMECLTPQFEGEEVKIRYCFHSKGLYEGESQGGELVVVCNQCSHSFSFHATISKLYRETSAGVIRNLYDFSVLAKTNWTEAYQLFYHKSFANIIKPKERKEAMIYRGIASAKPSNQNLEEFLVGIRKKQKIHFSVNRNSYDYPQFTESVKETIEIQKDSWGYIELEIISDCEFLVPSKKKITTEDFIGSTCLLDFMISYDKLHAGRNYGFLLIKGLYHNEEITFTIYKDVPKEPDKSRMDIKECKVGIMELYQAYRLKRIVTGVWANETVEALNHLQALEPDEWMYPLMKAQAFIINRQRQEAEWILDEFKRNWADRKTPIWGYYLYLMTLLEREPSYVDRMTQEIEVIFHEHPDSVLLFWVLLFLKEEYYNNSARKLKAIEYWVKKDCNSPYLYIEAYYLMWQEPYLLRRLGTFELRVLHWAIRQNALTKELAEQIFSIVEGTKNFSPTIYRLMCAAYKVNEKPAYIGMICSYLIKGQQYGCQYHSWFEQGIELNLRITGLYEAYLLSMDERAVSTVPKIIQMYFQYENSLPYKKMAVLYNNIIATKDENAQVYHKYRKAIGRFAMEQVELGHIDDNLAVLYKDMLELGLINQEIAHALAKILFTQKLIVMDSGMVRAFIYQRQLKEPQIVSLSGQTAYFQLYSREYVVIFEDAKGRRYAGSVEYQVQALMDTQKYLARCMELAPDELSYIVAYFDAKQNYLTFEKEDEKYFPRILFGKEFSYSYLAELVPEIIRFYRTREFEGTIKRYLEEADLELMPPVTRRYLMELLVENRIYDKAYALLSEYGIDQIGAAARVALASYMIEQYAYEEDEFLLQLTGQGFVSGKYNDVMLRYLSEFYQGPTDIMCSLWKALRQFEMEERMELEERILVQMLYEEQLTPDADEIFDSYCIRGGREQVVLAYLSYCVHAYFVQGRKTSEHVFLRIQTRFLKNQELNDACKLALLKRLSEEAQPTAEQVEIQDELLAEYTCRNMNFAFYRKMDKRLVMKYHFYDKVFLEYRADPRKHVVLHYSLDEDGAEFAVEDMPNVYGGIFVKTFVMFFGDMIQYYISEEYQSQVEVTQSSRIMNNDVYGEKDVSRYNLLNQMIISETLQEESSLYHNMKQYAGYDEVTKKVFKLL